MPRTRTTKKLAQRIDLEYFKRSSPLRHWQFLLSVALPALALLWLGWHGVRGDRRVYSAGALSSSHAVLTKQCAACHVTQAGFFSENVADQKCLACHDGAIHQAAQVFTLSCASCHADHRGAIRLAATSDANCTQCHANLTTRGAPINFARNMDPFETIIPNLPCFAPGAVTREPFKLITTGTCSRICSDRMAAACRWFARIATARRPMQCALALWKWFEPSGNFEGIRTVACEIAYARSRISARLYGAGDLCPHLRCLPFAAIRQTPPGCGPARHAGSDSSIYRGQAAGVHRGASRRFARAARSQPRPAWTTDSRGLPLADAAAMGRRAHRRSRATPLAQNLQTMPHAYFR